MADIQLPATRALALTDMYHDGIRSSVLQAFLALEQKNSEDFAEAEADLSSFTTDIQKQLSIVGQLNMSQGTKDQVAAAMQKVQLYVTTSSTLIRHLK